jgi:dolichol-phosphate mannosyltransferase
MFAAPRYWKGWAFWLWMRLTAALPIGWALEIHRRVGRAIYGRARRQRRIVMRNLELCFPELQPQQREALAKRHFEAVGMSFAECGIAWYGSDRRVAPLFDVRGREHLEAALAKGRGVILYTGHFTPLEICGRVFKALTPYFACMFTRRSNALVEELQRRGRLRIAHEIIPRDNVRVMMRSLKRNAVVWYAPDQVYEGGPMLRFFHELTPTNVATSKLARLTGATVLPFSYRRIEGEKFRYEVRFHAPLEDFPTADACADAERLTRRLEDFIRASPEQYLWTHRKFKGRPPPFADLYAKRSEHETEPEEAAPPGAPAAVCPAAPFSVVIPLNNEQDNVEPLVTELRAALAGASYEILLVDDGSTDETGLRVRRLAKDDTSLRLLSHSSRRGQSTALYNGVRAAANDIVVVLDGDLQNDPADIGKLLRRYWDDADRDSLGLIIGHRVHRRDSRVRKISSVVANKIRGSILHDQTPDTGCGLKLLRRSVFERLPYFDHMHRFLPALVRRAGHRVISVSVSHRPRVHGAAHYGVWDRAWVGVVDLIGVAWLMRRSQPADFREERFGH